MLVPVRSCASLFIQTVANLDHFVKGTHYISYKVFSKFDPEFLFFECMRVGGGVDIVKCPCNSCRST